MSPIPHFRICLTIPWDIRNFADNFIDDLYTNLVTSSIFLSTSAVKVEHFLDDIVRYFVPIS